jgi:hypothetical protein
MALSLGLSICSELHAQDDVAKLLFEENPAEVYAPTQDALPASTLPAVEVKLDEESNQPFKSGYKNGFFIIAPDNAFKLKVNGLLQARHYTTLRDIDPTVGDDLESGFTVERASVIFSGNAVSPKFHYWLVLSSSRASSDTYVEEGRISYEFENGALLQAGRMRNPAFLRELDISFARQMAIERSYYNRVFTTGLLEGLVLSKQNDYLRSIAILSDGRHSGSPASLKDFHQDSADYAITLGLDWKLDGEWAQFGDVTSWSDEGRAIFIGNSLHYERGETGDVAPVNNENHFIAWTMDIGYENAGFMIYASAAGRHQLIDGQAIDQSGALLESSYHLGCDDKYEFYSRCEYIDFDGFTDVGPSGSVVADSHVSLISFGVNRYFNRHAAKLTVEAIHALDTIPLAATNSGLLTDQLDRDGQTVIGAQLQLFF